MPQENTFDVRIAHSSPLFTALPLTGNQSTGWATLCTASGYPCDAPDQSAVYTMIASATMDLHFWGSRIELRGNATGGMEIDWQMDGSARSPDTNGVSAESASAVGERLGSGLLGVFGGLESGKMHTLRMTTKAGLPSAVMAFEGAVVTVGTGVAGGTVSRTYMDDTDTRLQYTQTPGGWASYNEYESPAFNITRPEGVTNTRFESTKQPGTSVSLTFNGTQVLLYGPCYASNGAYTISLDNQNPVVYNASLNAYSAPPVASVAGACLRYMSPPLASGQLHFVSMANADQGRETNLDWVLVVDNTGGEAIGSVGGKSKSNIGAIVGAVVGSVALLLALILLFFIIRRRRHNAKRITAHTGSENGPDERKLATLDLLSAQSDVPSLLSNQAKANVLTSPSHGSGSGSLGNERSFRRIEPFELPPLVDGVRNGGGKVGYGYSAGAEISPRSVDSGVMQAQQETAIASVGAPAPVPEPHVPSAPTISHVPSAPTSNVSQPVPPPATTTAHDASLSQPPPGSQAPAVPDLSQISSDVNRILVQLGQIRRRADSGAATARSPAVGDEDEESVPGDAPPEYGKHRRVEARSGAQYGL